MAFPKEKGDGVSRCARTHTPRTLAHSRTLSPRSVVYAPVVGYLSDVSARLASLQGMVCYVPGQRFCVAQFFPAVSVRATFVFALFDYSPLRGKEDYRWLTIT